MSDPGTWPDRRTSAHRHDQDSIDSTREVGVSESGYERATASGSGEDTTPRRLEACSGGRLFRAQRLGVVDRAGDGVLVRFDRKAGAPAPIHVRRRGAGAPLEEQLLARSR